MFGQPDEVLHHPLAFVRGKLGQGKTKFAETIRLHGRARLQSGNHPIHDLQVGTR